MKKNRFVKIAAVVFTLCLITTCGISSTLAKYTTGGNAQDSARVAKWGVQLTMEGDPLFKNDYTTDESADYYTGLSVSGSTKVVAPGTSSAKAGSSSRFSITGKPEVAVVVDISFSILNDVVLKAGTYHDATKAAVEKNNTLSYEKFTLANDYYPVVFTLKQVEDANNDDLNVVIAQGNLEAIKDAINTYYGESGAKYAPNTDLTAEFELSWEWVINGNDAADTYLGNIAATSTSDDVLVSTYKDIATGANLSLGVNYNIYVGYELAITVTQID